MSKKLNKIARTDAQRYHNALLVRDEVYAKVDEVVSRVAVGVHYPRDVAAGALIGAVTALALWMPPARGLLHGLGGRLSEGYERLGGAASRQLSRRSSVNS